MRGLILPLSWPGSKGTIVLAWIQGNPRRFKVYMGNRVAQILELTTASSWNHVASEDNPADCASRGMFPSELLTHDLWWCGQSWLKLQPSKWPKFDAPASASQEEEEELNITIRVHWPWLKNLSYPLTSYHPSTHIMLGSSGSFIIARRRLNRRNPRLVPLEELDVAANYWYAIVQKTHFPDELRILAKESRKVPTSSRICSLNPFIDDQGILRVGGRQQKAKFSYNSRHPVILDSKHPFTKLLIRSEHSRLLHGGPLIVSSSIFRNFHIIGEHQAIRSIVRSCVVCRRRTPKTKPQMMGQLPPERITPDSVFEHIGLDFAGPLYLKRGSTRKPIILKSYVCVFVWMSVKAVHLELVSDLSTESFIACLRRFVARRKTFLNLQ